MVLGPSQERAGMAVQGIKKYGSYFLSRQWLVSKWHPVLKV